MPSEIDSAPAMAFNNTNDYSEPPYGENFYPPSAPPTADNNALYMAGIVIAVVAIFMFLILVSTILRRRFSIAREDPLNLRSMGFDARVIDALPVFEYKAQSFREALECAVCLSEFEENEKGRFLPNCKHRFHVECIDMWFHSHSNCPVCRTGVQPKPWVSNNNTDEISINLELISSGNREFGISPGLLQGETSSQEARNRPGLTTVHERNLLDAGKLLERKTALYSEA